ncbi:Trk K+ transport system, NAD-binding component [Halogranum amylolyticum]|uniref:Trk K+ transport system, NAD-binding component n=1 Tax=Halogranum amylolyticum TaxID=660520 RepID=A0A1H8RLJ8_9EURY|nr:NAD-binding protein [Halogranum amylolyticum]SEO67212.1 Trk K+ transport system, NAD-binding component [Halogranum amylolyticum]
MSSSRPGSPLEQQLKRLSSVESLGDLSERQWKVLKFILVLVAIILVYAVIYQIGMARFEGEERSFLRSLQTVINTLTTTGYGGDAPWQSDIMNALLAWYQISGVIMGFVTLRILIIPLFERAPVILDERLTAKDGHVVVCEYGRGKDVLLDELQESDVEYVLVDSDKEEALDLSNRDYQVIDGDPTKTETLQRASVGDAGLVVVDARNRNASIVLTARQLNENARIVCLTETPQRREALERVGADCVVCLPALIGQRLAEKASVTFNAETAPDVIGDGPVVRELLVRRSGPLHGESVGKTAIASNPELRVVAAWIDGELRLPPREEDVLTSNATLVVVGPEEAFDAIRTQVTGIRSPRTHSSVVVAGLGEAGQSVVDSLPDGVDVTTLDVDETTDADVVGDASERTVLSEAGVEDATALVVAVDDDDTALLTAAVGRAMTDDIEILARMTEDENVSKAFDAGADYALSEQRTTARMIASEIYRDRIFHPIGQVRFVEFDGEPFVDHTLSEEEERLDSGVVLVGVRRDGAFYTADDTDISAGDSVVVAGTDERLRELEHEIQ